jgi:hypothetical protein
LLPAGWPHAVATPVDCLALGGELYHCGGLAAHMQAWRAQCLLGESPAPEWDWIGASTLRALARLRLQLTSTIRRFPLAAVPALWERELSWVGGNKWIGR